MKPALILSLLIACASLLTSAEPLRQAPPAPITIFLVRHAEPSPTTPDQPDPSLSEAGRARAEALARLLAKSGATTLISSELARTRETLVPLAANLGVEIETAASADVPALATRLRELDPGTVAVVAGHSNTVPALAEALGAPALAGTEEHPRYGTLLPHAEHDRVVEIVLPGCPDAPVRAVELRYGE